MTFKSIDDITREREFRDKERMKQDISNDVSQMFNTLRKNIKDDRNKNKTERKKHEGKFIKILKFIGLLGLGMLILNFILFNVWLLIYFIKSIFLK